MLRGGPGLSGGDPVSHQKDKKKKKSRTTVSVCDLNPRTGRFWVTHKQMKLYITNRGRELQRKGSPCLPVRPITPHAPWVPFRCQTREHIGQKQCVFPQRKISSPKTASDCRKPGIVPKVRDRAKTYHFSFFGWPLLSLKSRREALSSLVSRHRRLSDQNVPQALKRKGIPAPARTWMNLDDMMLGGITSPRRTNRV
ncbi:unnamed protein product [Nyctereutes procyonoides]|uniref:(raccoon dog) hypothetical protein n=1 Tax=Nyctereutes procyonoides TaxID=34880 RepID=A0A811ZKV1_NYCPR|nr:unnamed protein product [Nyctereutes procyonoides]